MKISTYELRAAIVHPEAAINLYVAPEGTLMIKFRLLGDFILWLLYNDHSDKDIDGTMRGISNIQKFYANGTLLDIDVEDMPSELALEPAIFAEACGFSYKESVRYIGVVTNCGYEIDIYDSEILNMLMYFIAAAVYLDGGPSGDALLDSYYNQLVQNGRLNEGYDAMMYQ